MKDSKKLTGEQLFLIIVLYLCVIGLSVLLVLNLKKQKEVIQNGVDKNNMVNEIEDNKNITQDDTLLPEDTIQEQKTEVTPEEEIKEDVKSDNDSNLGLEDDIFNLMG